ncbi:MAG: hypothetical protein PQ964_00500 [Methanobacteriaceae archaeon]|jgi:hypothetical protein
MNKTQTGELGHVRMIGERTARAINTVHLNGNGYSINLTMPDTPIFNASVTTTGNVSSVIMKHGSNNITIRLIPRNVRSIVMSNGGRYRVRNNGTIIIERIL